MQYGRSNQGMDGVGYADPYLRRASKVRLVVDMPICPSAVSVAGCFLRVYWSTWPSSMLSCSPHLEVSQFQS